MLNLLPLVHESPTDNLTGVTMFDKITLACLGIFLVLFGVLTVTNIDVTWSHPIMGFAALIAGVVCCVKAIKT
jgi:hypothetical protein